MKKRVKSILLLTAATLSVGAFAAGCGEVEEPHVHTYSEDWTKDAEGHFHQALCDDAEDEAKQPHVDNNNDGACDICEFTDHTHTYSENWTVDCTNHWHAADCGHIVAGADVAAHVDENSDGKCDVCKYVIEDIHEHYFDTNWTGDTQYHWHAALCEHKDEISGKEAHNLNAAGDCTVCGASINAVDVTKIADVLAATAANNYKIIDGAVVETQEVWGGTGKGTLEQGAKHEVYFVLGKNDSYINYKSFDKNGAFIGVEEQWHQKVGDEYYGVKLGAESESPERELEPMMSAAQFLNGYNYTPGSVIASADVDTSTLSNMLMALYNQMKAGTHVSDATENYDEETGKYTFAYTYYSVNAKKWAEGSDNAGEWDVEVELYHVNVEFSINEDMIIDQADFSVEVYRDYGDDATGDRDLTYTFNAETQDVENLAKKATANPTFYKYSVAQHAGERTFTSPFPRESLIPTELKFYYVTEYDFPSAAQFDLISEVPLGDSLTLDEGTYAYFHLGDVLPLMASLNFINTEDITCSFVNKNGTGRAWYAKEDSLINGYSAKINCFKLKMRDPGEYTVTFAYGDIVKTFDLTIVDDPDIGGEVGGGDSNADYTTVITVDSGSVWFSADELSSGDVIRTLTITEAGKYKVFGDGFYIETIVDEENTVIAPTLGVYEFAVGSYKVTFGKFGTAGTRPDTEYTVNVVKQADEPAPDQGKDISGTYSDGTGTLEIDGATNTIVYSWKSNTATFTYTIEDNKVTLYQGGSPLSSMMAMYISLTLDADGNPATWTYNGYTKNLTKVGGGNAGDDNKEPTAVTDVQIQPGTNNLTLEANTFIDVSMQGFVGDYTVSWDVTSVTVEINGMAITNGSIFTSTSPMVANSFKIYGKDYAAVASLKLTITQYVAPVTEMVVGENTLSVSGQGSTVEFTATEAGTYTFTVGANGVLGYDYGSYYEGESVEITLAAGQTVEFYVGTENWEDGDVIITVALGSAGGDVGGGDDPVDPNPGETEEPKGWLDEGESDVEVTADDLTKGYVLYNLMAGSAGEYNIWGGDVFVVGIWDDNGEEITTNDNGYYELEEWGTYLVKISTEFVSAANTYTLNVDYQYPEGAQENPIWLYATENEVVWNGGYSPVWHAYSVYEDGVLTVSSDNANATILVCLRYGYELEGTGSVSLNVMAGATYYIGIMGDMEATEAETITFTVAVTEGEYEGDGTANMPVEIDLGEVNVDVPEWESKYIAYRATAYGTLVMKTTDENADWYAIYDGKMIYADENGEIIIEEMFEGNVVIFYVGSYAMTDSTISFNASWKAAPTANYDATIVEGENDLTIEENTYIQVDVEGLAAGDYTVTWDNDDVIVKVDYEEIANGDTFTSYSPMWMYTFQVYANGYTAANVKLTIAKVVVPGTPAELGENTVTVNNTSTGTTMEFTATEAGKYTITAGENAVIDYAGYILPGESTEVELDAGETISFVVYTEDYTEGDVVVTIAKAVEEDDEPTQPAGPTGTQNDPFVITENPYTKTFETGFDAYFTYTATEKCTVVITRTGGSLDAPAGFDYDMGTKTHTGVVNAGNTINFNFYSGVAQTLTVTITPVIEEEVQEEDVPTYEGNGTQSNRYVIPSDAEYFAFKGKHDVYVTYTAPKSGLLVITYADGITINGLPSGFVKDGSAMTWSGEVTEGQVIEFNPWTLRTADVVYKCTISITEIVQPEPEEPEEPGEGGEDVGGATETVTYLASHSGGRKYKVEIAGDSITVTRSDLTGNFPVGGVTVNTGTISGDTITLTNCTVTLSNGVPVYLKWGSQEVNAFDVI